MTRPNIKYIKPRSIWSVSIRPIDDLDVGCGQAAKARYRALCPVACCAKQTVIKEAVRPALTMIIRLPAHNRSPVLLPSAMLAMITGRSVIATPCLRQGRPASQLDLESSECVLVSNTLFGLYRPCLKHEAVVHRRLKQWCPYNSVAVGDACQISSC